MSHTAQHARSRWWQLLPLSLHAGWVSLAVFLNVARVIVAFQLFSVTHMLNWTLILFALAAVLLLTMIVRLRGNPWYALAVVWGLVGAFAKQHASTLAGANVAAWIAPGLTAVVVVTLLWQVFGAAHPGQRQIGH